MPRTAPAQKCILGHIPRPLPPNRTRNNPAFLWLTEDEKALIYQKMRQAGTDNFSAYARKMLIDGYVIQVDYSDVKKMTAEIQKIGVNINQIARRVNATGTVYEADIQEIKERLAQIWQALDYITDPQKTEEKLLVSSYGCSVETADIEMEFTLKQCYQKGNNLAHHLIQSFEPGEVSYEDAHRIGKELAEEILGGKYEYVLTTHIDKGHVHNHLIFCAADFVIVRFVDG